MKKLIISSIFSIILISISISVHAEQNLGSKTITWYTEVWHHSGGYWSGNISKTVFDSELGVLTYNDNASKIFTNAFSEYVTVYNDFPDTLNNYLDAGGNVNDVNVAITPGNGKESSTCYIEGTFSYILDTENKRIKATFKPSYILRREPYYLDFNMPKTYYPCDYIKFSIYHKSTNQLLGVMAANGDFNYDWITGLSGELYHPDNPFVVVSNYGVEKQYRLNDLKIGNGTFKDGGAVGYFFTNSFIFEFSAPNATENPSDPSDNPPTQGTPSLNVYFSILCNDYYATNNPDYPVYVDAYPVYLDLLFDYEYENTRITKVTVERKYYNSWTVLKTQNGIINSFQYNTSSASETFRITVESEGLPAMSVTASSYTKLKDQTGGWVAVDFYLYDKKGRIVNDNYNNPIEVTSLPDTLELLNIIHEDDTNFTCVNYYLQGGIKIERLDVVFGRNKDIPAKYLDNMYYMTYIYKNMCPDRLPNHHVFFKIVDPELKVTAEIEGYINKWDGDTDMSGNILEDNSHRFLSLEKIKINVYTEGYADKVVIRFSPELESMTYKSTNSSNVYDMKNDLNIDYTYFPEDTTFHLDSSLEKNMVYWEYYLPLAEDTLNWNDERVKPSYSLYVYAYKGDKCDVYIIDDIEITGSLYDIIHIQPVY